MKNKKLIKLLKQFDGNAQIIITGLYGSETTDIDIFKVKKEREEDYFVKDKSYGIICISTDLCTG